MGWKLAIAGAVSLVPAVFCLRSHDAVGVLLGYAFLLVGAVSVPLGVMMMHLDRRIKELARELFRMKAELLRTRKKPDDEGAGGDADAEKDK